MITEHLPVLVREVIDVLAPVKGGIYIDATIGLGGHSEEILKMIGQNGMILGIDKDDAALRRTRERLDDARLVLKKGSFSDVENLLNSQDIKQADGILFDLGVSMMQIKDFKRGFSFHSDERLDMRMDTSHDLTAWDVVNCSSEKELIRILKDYGEERMAAKIAKSLINYRYKKSIDTCSELADIILHTAGRRGKTHPATKTFQALRIEVNRELEELRLGLNASIKIIKSGGRLCVISYHSLEDRTVKNFIKESTKNGVLKKLSKKPICPSAEEVRINPSSRSAKLRGAERL